MEMRPWYHTKQFILLDWFWAYQPNILLLHYPDGWYLDWDFWVSVYLDENATFTAHAAVNLTWLTLSASAIDFAPSAPSSLSYRLRILIVCIFWWKYKLRIIWDNWSHLIDFERVSQIFCSFGIYTITSEVKIRKCLSIMFHVMKSHWMIAFFSLDCWSELLPDTSRVQHLICCHIDRDC